MSQIKINQLMQSYNEVMTELERADALVITIRAKRAGLRAALKRLGVNPDDYSPPQESEIEELVDWELAQLDDEL